jgi:hypothetical protein
LAGAEPFLFPRAEEGRSTAVASAFDSEGEAGKSDGAVFFESFFDFVATFIGLTDDAALRK